MPTNNWWKIEKKRRKIKLWQMWVRIVLITDVKVFSMLLLFKIFFLKNTHTNEYINQSYVYVTDNVDNWLFYRITSYSVE